MGDSSGAASQGLASLGSSTLPLPSQGSSSCALYASLSCLIPCCQLSEKDLPPSLPSPAFIFLFPQSPLLSPLSPPPYFILSSNVAQAGLQLEILLPQPLGQDLTQVSHIHSPCCLLCNDLAAGHTKDSSPLGDGHAVTQVSWSSEFYSCSLWA